MSTVRRRVVTKSGATTGGAHAVGTLSERFKQIELSRTKAIRSDARQHAFDSKRMGGASKPTPVKSVLARLGPAQSSASVLSRIGGIQARLGKPGKPQGSVKNGKPLVKGKPIPGKKVVIPSVKGGAAARGQTSQRGAAGRGRGGKKGAVPRKPKPATRDALDKELDSYMMKDPDVAAKKLDEELDAYMEASDSEQVPAVSA